MSLKLQVSTDYTLMELNLKKKKKKYSSELNY